MSRSGERIIVTGRVLDSDGRPVRNTVVEIWQANAAGRYLHQGDQHPAPLDPNFTGAGRCLTDADGRYRFITIKPGAYPWKNHHNAWRPAHIHFSLFGSQYRSRLVTQMYFPGDPLMPRDPILQSIPDQAGRDRLVSYFDPETTVAGVGPRLPLGHRAPRPGRDTLRERGMSAPLTPSQTVGPFFGVGLPFEKGDHVAPPGRLAPSGSRARSSMETATP